MRILLANDEAAGAGGVETYLSALLPALQAQGHEVGVLHLSSSAASGPIRIVPAGVWHVSANDSGMAGALARVRAFAPDVCFSHNMRALEVDEGLLREWPVVKMMHGHFGTCVSGHKAFAFPRACACSRDFGPGCLVHYLPRRCGQASGVAMVRQYAWGTRQRALFPRYAAIVVASRFMRESFVRAGVTSDRVRAIPLFASNTTVSEPLDRTSRSIDVLFLGRMTPLKGPELLLRAVAGHAASARVTLAGDGPERPRLQQLASSLGIDAKFPGWVTGAERDALLRQSVILAVPSVWPEPFGLVGLEAARFGTPAVAFDTGGISEWLSDGLNGRLVGPSRGPEGLGEVIAAVLHDEVTWHRLSTGARAASDRFTLPAYITALERVLTEAIVGSDSAAALSSKPAQALSLEP
jgi:glycosyltransferase involved in cell wall biosynthesis